MTANQPSTSTMHDPPTPFVEFLTYQEECEKITGALESDSVCFCVSWLVCERSIILGGVEHAVDQMHSLLLFSAYIPTRFISSTILRPFSESPP